MNRNHGFRLAAIILMLVLSGCSVDIAKAVLAVPDLVRLGGAAVDAAQSEQPSRLVCNPAGEKVVDPTTECHSETE